MCVLISLLIFFLLLLLLLLTTRADLYDMEGRAWVAKGSKCCFGDETLGAGLVGCVERSCTKNETQSFTPVSGSLLDFLRDDRQVVNRDSSIKDLHKLHCSTPGLCGPLQEV